MVPYAIEQQADEPAICPSGIHLHLGPTMNDSKNRSEEQVS